VKYALSKIYQLMCYAFVICIIIAATNSRYKQMLVKNMYVSGNNSHHYTPHHEHIVYLYFKKLQTLCMYTYIK